MRYRATLDAALLAFLVHRPLSERVNDERL
jgi:hypothetical protein